LDIEKLSKRKLAKHTRHVSCSLDWVWYSGKVLKQQIEVLLRNGKKWQAF